MRRNRILWVTLGLVGLVVVAMLFLSPTSETGLLPETPEEFRTWWYGLSPEVDELPATLTVESLSELSLGFVGLSGMDLSTKDLSQLSTGVLAGLAFDSYTKWPTELPEGFEPEAWLEKARDPGLGIRELHAQGITGSGISVAVFDKPILNNHEEFGGQLDYRQIAPDSADRWHWHFHGIAVASILGGKTVGVAPDAQLYYFANPMVGRHFHYYSLGIDEVIRLNQTLPTEDRIRLISISDGIGPDDPDMKEWTEALDRAKAAGISVLYSTGPELKNVVWGGCLPTEDCDRPENFRFSSRFEAPEALLVPGDFRTTAINTGTEDYMYWGEGGFSWAIPYVAGVAVLAWQVDPELPFQEFIDLMHSTASELEDGTRVINPRGIVEAVRSR